MPFGKHMGKKLSTLPPSYLDWLSDSISSGRFPTRPELKTALQSIGISHPPSIPSLNPHWRAPSIHLAPSEFYDWMSGEPTWITESDARKYFGVGREVLAELPRTRGGDFDLVTGAPSPFAMAREKIWLVHVWDVVRTHRSRGVADEALGKFLEKNKRQEQEIFDAMGLGALVD
jgi:Putative quorum-sensing-regulated virulence factor